MPGASACSCLLSAANWAHVVGTARWYFRKILVLYISPSGPLSCGIPHTSDEFGDTIFHDHGTKSFRAAAAPYLAMLSSAPDRARSVTSVCATLTTSGAPELALRAISSWLYSDGPLLTSSFTHTLGCVRL